jgi:hypothetical protein
VQGTVKYLVASLFSAYKMLMTLSCTVVTTTDVSRHCQVSLAGNESELSPDENYSSNYRNDSKK